MIKLEDVYSAVRKILPEGELYAIGGCVRDHLLNKPPKDFDFCTNLTPEQMKPLIEKAGRHYYGIGEKFGTVGCKIPVLEYNDYEDDFGPQWHTREVYVYVEITTYRSEIYYPGSRKPEVQFGTNLRGDLKRRDFTINSLAFDGKEVIDLFAGRIDLNDGLIKSVGEPKKMLSDDPLRILRAIRFAIQLNFKIEQNLFNHLKRFNPKLFDVAIERQIVELDKMFAIDPRRSLALLYEIGYLNNFLPELIGYSKTYETELLKLPLEIKGRNIDEIWKKILSKTGEFLKEDKDSTTLTNNNHKRTKFLNKGICNRFKFSNKRRKEILDEA